MFKGLNTLSHNFKKYLFTNNGAIWVPAPRSAMKTHWLIWGQLSFCPGYFTGLWKQQGGRLLCKVCVFYICWHPHCCWCVLVCCHQSGKVLLLALVPLSVCIHISALGIHHQGEGVRMVLSAAGEVGVGWWWKVGCRSRQERTRGKRASQRKWVRRNCTASRVSG